MLVLALDCLIFLVYYMWIIGCYFRVVVACFSCLVFLVIWVVLFCCVIGVCDLRLIGWRLWLFGFRNAGLLICDCCCKLLVSLPVGCSCWLFCLFLTLCLLVCCTLNSCFDLGVFGWAVEWGFWFDLVGLFCWVVCLLFVDLFCLWVDFLFVYLVVAVICVYFIGVCVSCDVWFWCWVFVLFCFDVFCVWLFWFIDFNSRLRCLC